MQTPHAPADMLLAYADGTLSDGLSLLVASHLTYCPRCREHVARIEALGGALFCEGPEADLSPGCLARAMARLDEAEAAPAPLPEAGDTVLPAPLRQRMGSSAADIRWRFLLPGISEHKLSGFEGEDVSLLRARPGVRILSHTHSDLEATLVLSGRMRDGDRVYARGDVAVADRRDEHRPEIIGEETCICFVVLTGKMRFTGPVGRALNLLNR